MFRGHSGRRRTVIDSAMNGPLDRLVRIDPASLRQEDVMVTARHDTLDAIEHQLELPGEFNAPRPSAEERMAAGKALRASVPHERHAEYRPAPNRRDPVEILEEQAKTRVPRSCRSATRGC